MNKGHSSESSGEPGGIAAWFRGWRLLLIAILLSYGVLAAWAVSSPLGASPDEHYHAASTWCAHGLNKPGRCEPGPTPGEVLVPSELAASWCFPHAPETSAACATTSEALRNPLSPFPKSYVNAETGNYPEGYYWLTGWLVTPSVTASLVLIRLFNAALFIAIFFGIVALAGVALRQALVLAWLVCLVPLGLFLIPSINPSSWAITGAGLSWAAAFALAQAQRRRDRWILGAILAACLGMTVLSRVDAAAYALLGAVIGVSLSAPARDAVIRRWRAAVALGAFLVVAIGALLVSTAQWDFITAPVTGIGEGGVDLLLGNLLEVPQLWSGVLGTWGLGQLDVPLPSSVPVLGLLAVGGLLLWGLARLWRAKGIALAVLLLILVLAPVLFLQSQKTTVGVWVQPRYLLPLILVFVAIALLDDRAAPSRLSRVQAIVIAAAAALAAAIALHRMLRRYVTGIDVGTSNLASSVEWWWSGFPGPLWVWIAGSLMFAALAALAAWCMAWRQPSP